MSILTLMTEALGVAADGIHSASVSTSGASTGAVSLAQFPQVLFVIDSGTLGTSGTLDFNISGSATSGGTYTTITGTAITQLVKATGDNKYVLVTINADKINSLGLNYAFIKGNLTPGTAASTSSVTVLGANSAYEPSSLNNATSVVQTLAIWR